MGGTGGWGRQKAGVACLCDRARIGSREGVSARLFRRFVQISCRAWAGVSQPGWHEPHPAHILPAHE
jgi:hypothetical protein